MTGRLISTANLATATKFLQSNSSQLIGRLRGVPKILFWLILLLNIRSLPFAWHIRVFWPTVTWRLHYYRWMLPYIFKPRSLYATAKEAWFDSISPIGRNPYEYVIVQKTWASVDDSDFNSHLSNSSYARTLDGVRLKAALSCFPSFFRAGGCMALAGTHYSFVREIPMFSKYEVRVSTFGWDNKWYFVIARFVSNSKHRKKQGSKGMQEDRPGTPDFNPSPLIVNGSSTPIQHLPVDHRSVTTPAMAARRLAAGVLQAGEPDDATLHCVHISQTCFKIGRVTIPPAIVLATNGFVSPPSKGTAAYSHTNPPPHWDHVKALRCAPHGNMKIFTAFLKGGWRDIPDGERWWETALAGPVENQRKANMVALNNVRTGMEVVKKPEPLLHPSPGNGEVVVPSETF